MVPPRPLVVSSKQPKRSSGVLPLRIGRLIVLPTRFNRLARYHIDNADVLARQPCRPHPMAPRPAVRLVLPARFVRADLYTWDLLYRTSSPQVPASPPQLLSAARTHKFFSNHPCRVAWLATRTAGAATPTSGHWHRSPARPRAGSSPRRARRTAVRRVARRRRRGIASRAHVSLCSRVRDLLSRSERSPTHGRAREQTLTSRLPQPAQAYSAGVRS